MPCSCTPADVLKAAWKADSTLNAAIPATDGETNAFFEEGLPPNLKLDRMPKEYVVVEDFGTTTNDTWTGGSGYVNDVAWQLRVRIYSGRFGSSRKVIRDLAQQFKTVFKSIPADNRCWDGGGMCTPKISSERMDLTVTGLRIYEFFLLVPATSD